MTASSVFMLACMAVLNDAPMCERFAAWHSTHRLAGGLRTYVPSDAIFATRCQAFAASEKRIKEVSARNPLATFEHNEFSDFTTGEFKRMQGHIPVPLAEEIQSKSEWTSETTDAAPESLDWGKLGKLSPVKNQGQCGSCWAHAAVETVESQLAIATNSSVVQTLSVQQLVSCDQTMLNCDGGNPYQAFQYLAQSGAMALNTYPTVSGFMKYNCGGTFGVVKIRADYCVPGDFGSRCLSLPNYCPVSSTVGVGERASDNSTFCVDGQCGEDWFGCCLTNVAADAAVVHDGRGDRPRIDASSSKSNGGCGYNCGKQCLYNSASATKVIGGGGTVSGEGSFQTYIGTTGPLAIGVDATDMQSYKSGIMTSCSQGQVDHSVQLVGYGTEGNVPYWNVRNSWAPNWGEAGFVRLQRGSNQCNMAASPGYFPTGVVVSSN